MSRCVTLYRPPPTVEDLSITAQGMVQSVSLLEERRSVEIVVILVVGVLVLVLINSQIARKCVFFFILM